MYGDFPAKITVCTPYIRKSFWFWPTLTFSWDTSETCSTCFAPLGRPTAAPQSYICSTCVHVHVCIYVCVCVCYMCVCQWRWGPCFHIPHINTGLCLRASKIESAVYSRDFAKSCWELLRCLCCRVVVECAPFPWLMWGVIFTDCVVFLFFSCVATPDW
jgi:hypothetical protein